MKRGSCAQLHHAHRLYLGYLPAVSRLYLGYISAVSRPRSSIMVTGVVHADPHEGNLLLGTDGRLASLDFKGLHAMAT